MEQNGILSKLKRVYENGFDPELLEVLPEEVDQAERADWNAGGLLEGEAVPPRASALAITLLYVENLRENGKNELHRRLETILKDQAWPVLHCRLQDERSAAEELCATIEAKGVLREEERRLVLDRCILPTALALYVYWETNKYIKIADIATAMTLEAVRGEVGAFDARLHELARPFPGQIASAENVRRLVEHSDMTTEKGRLAFGYDKHPRVQDAISLRAAPQTHGGVRDVHAWLAGNLEETLHRGMAGEGFLLEYGIDWLLIALADLGNICVERTFRLTEERFSYGLPTNLVFHQGYNHGYPVVQACQTAMLAELKLKALPSAAVKTGGMSMAYSSAVRAIEALPLLSKVLATEVLMAAQAMDIVQDKLPDFHFGKGTQAAWGVVRSKVDVLKENRFVAPDMCAADELVADGSLLAATEQAIGQLS